MAEQDPTVVGPPSGPVMVIEPAGDTDAMFPLSVMQHASWMGRHDAQPLGGVAAHRYAEFDGCLVDPVRLAASVERLIARHDMLRVRITDNGQQQILPMSGWRGLTVHDVRGLDAEARHCRLQAIRNTASRQMLDIERGEVLATALSLLPDGRTRLHLDVDMVVADAPSYRILLTELARLYEGAGSEDIDTTLPAIGDSYRRYVGAQATQQGAAREHAAEWWRERLRQLPGAPELPLVSRPGARPGSEPVQRRFRLSARERAVLSHAARRHGATLAMALATAFAEVIGAWSAWPQFVLNMPLFDRQPGHPGVDQVVGDFSSSVLLEVDLLQCCSFAARVRQLRSRMHAATEHRTYSGVEVLRDLTRRRGAQVLAPVVFTSMLGFGELIDAGVQRCFGDLVWTVSQRPQVLLDAQLAELDSGLLVSWDVREQEFAEGVVNGMFGAFDRLVRRLIEEPASWDRPVDELVPQSQLEVRRPVVDPVGPADLADSEPASPCRGRLLHQGFFEWSARTPDAPALLADQGGTLSYRELADRALRVAAALRERGVAPGDPVGICLPEGAGQIVAVLGVLAAGGVCVPVGVDQPVIRARRIERAAGFRVLLTDEAAADLEVDHGSTRTLPLRLVLAEALATQGVPEPVLGDQDRAAYVLFVSGATGEPKGVEVAHRAAMNTIDALNERLGLGPCDRTLAVSAADADLTVFDVFGPLCAGGAVVLVGRQARPNPPRWAQLIREHAVTVLNCVPAQLDELLRTGTDLGAGLRVVLVGGDRIDADLPRRLAAAVPGCRFVGWGGTTETALHSTVCEVSSVPAHWRSVPYGTPLRNVACRVVDRHGRDCPDWVAGELWIGGAGVADGYRGDPELTADRFVQQHGTRWYRTGDFGRYWPDGTIEFLGRRDNQVRIGDLRIELGEIDAALLAQPEVRAAVTVVTGQRPRVLAAGVVVNGADGEISPEQVRAEISTVLPTAMVPKRVLLLPAIPLTVHGTADRRAVRALTDNDSVGIWGADGHRAAPRTALERAIVLIWSDVLAVGGIGAHDEFVALGGDSVLATVIVARLREELDTTAVSVRMLYCGPTIAALAQRMLAAETVPGRLEQVAEVFLEIQMLSSTDAVECRFSRCSVLNGTANR